MAGRPSGDRSVRRVCRRRNDWDPGVRSAAAKAKSDVAALVMAHEESKDFAPFEDADYTNAVGPNVHFPIAPKQVDPWAARRYQRNRQPLLQDGRARPTSSRVIA